MQVITLLPVSGVYCQMHHVYFMQRTRLPPIRMEILFSAARVNLEREDIIGDVAFVVSA